MSPRQRIILVGAGAGKDGAPHPGGQHTASMGLARYAEANGYSLEIIDITQSNFPVPPVRRRLMRGVRRIAALIRLLCSGGLKGVIVFAASGLSVVERICMCALCRVFRVPEVLFVLSGHFMNDVNASAWTRLWARVLLKIPFRIGAQGTPWVDLYKSLGVDERRIIVARNWLPPWVTLSGARDGTRIVGHVHFIFVGWLVRAKGVNELMDAIGMLKPHYPFRVSIVGGGTLEPSLKTVVEQRGWGDDIAVLGWKSADEVQALLAQADVFVLPSHAEGFPNALLEAMAKGLPAICADVGGIRDSLIDGENGFLIAPRRASALAEAMEKYLQDPGLIQKHSEAALRILAKNHDWKSNCQQVFDVFDLQENGGRHG